MKNLHLLTKLFLIISIFLVLPLITVTLIYNYNVLNYSEEEISRFATINLKNIKEMNELILDSTIKDLARISLSSSLENLNQISNFDSMKGNTDKILIVNQAVNQLKEVAYSNYRIRSIDIYLSNADIVVSSTGSIDRAQEYEDYDWLRGYMEQKSDYGETPSWVSRKRIYGSETINGRDNISTTKEMATNVISYIYPLSLQPTKVEGCIILNLNEKQFSDFINKSNIGGDEYFYVIDSQGTVISHVDKSLIGNNIKKDPVINRIINEDKASGFIKQEIDGTNDIVTYYKSGSNNWIYVGVYPLDNLLKKSNTLRLNLLLIVLLFIFVGILLSYFTSKRLYNPLENLVRDIKNRKGIDLNGNENEMVLLSKAFNELSKRDDLLSEKIESNKRSLEEAFLLSLLKGEDISDDTDLNIEGFTSDDMLYMCGVCTIDRYQLFENKYPKDEQYYCKMLFIGICQQVFNNTVCCKGLILDKNRIVILLASKESATDEGLIKFVTEGFKSVQMELAKAFDISVTIGLSQAVTGRSNIKDIFNSAENACRKRMLEGFGRIIISEDKYEEASVYFYPYDVEKRILNKLSIGQKEEIYSELEELSKELKAKDNLSSDNIVQLFNQLVGNTIKYLVESGINISDVYTDNYNIYMGLASRETLDDIIILLKDFYKRIIDNTNNKDIEDKQYIDRIMEYIRQHFNVELDIDNMVKYTGISYSYIRKIIKQETGKSVIDHINELRIEEAKKLLRQTNLKINDIALNIGYNNDQSFSRFFKKIEGITPGEFRNINVK